MDLKQFLVNEVKPALGCTEPGAVALASATAARHIGCEVESIHVEMSGSIFKNGVNVGVPGTNGGTGNLLAAALGAAVGNPELGLRSLSGITPVDVEKAHAFVDSGRVTRFVHLDKPYVFIRVTLKGARSCADSLRNQVHQGVHGCP
jgi:L-cysteine desulfidase